jgi:hypothetical protein
MPTSKTHSKAPSKRILSVKIKTIADDNLGKYLDGGEFIYIRAEAEIGIGNGHIPQDWTLQRITSSGLGGVESDDAHPADVRKEELADLRGQLKALGFSTRAISKAFQNVQEQSE